MNTSILSHAREFQVGEQNFIFTGTGNVNNLNLHHPYSGGPLKELEGHIAVEALHDSAERCDAPKCDPETRVAVQEDLYSWIIHSNTAHPREMKWLTGPAGSGKTAIMGSVTEHCKKTGVPLISFFFSSTGSLGRRTKTSFVTTMAYQLAHHRKDLKDAISAAVEVDPVVFKKNLSAQMEALVLAPLRIVAGSNERLRGVVLVDGLDECGVERPQGGVTPGKRETRALGRRNDEEQLEILEVLHTASLDPAWPFRILIASRPEHIFRLFFSRPTAFAQKIDLHEDYNATADITLFLKAHFGRIRREYDLPGSWPPPGTIEALVEKASGQFIYATTVIRFLDSRRQEPLQALKTILQVEAKTTSNPFEQLDILYSHILRSSLNLRLSILWIRSINRLNTAFIASAPTVRLLLQTDPESREAEHLLGSLHSLIQIPPTNHQVKTVYGFYHKSLLDFLEDRHRCGELYVEETEVKVFIWEGFLRACSRGSDTQSSAPDDYLKYLACVPILGFTRTGNANARALPTPASANWWVSLAIRHDHNSLWDMCRKVHHFCPWYRCKPGCQIWSRSILRRLKSSTWTAPGLWWPMRRLEDPITSEQAKFQRLVEAARKREGVDQDEEE